MILLGETPPPPKKIFFLSFMTPYNQWFIVLKNFVMWCFRRRFLFLPPPGPCVRVLFCQKWPLPSVCFSAPFWWTHSPSTLSLIRFLGWEGIFNGKISCPVSSKRFNYINSSSKVQITYILQILPKELISWRKMQWNEVRISLVATMIN